MNTARNPVDLLDGRRAHLGAGVVQAERGVLGRAERVEREHVDPWSAGMPLVSVRIASMVALTFSSSPHRASRHAPTFFALASNLSWRPAVSMGLSPLSARDTGTMALTFGPTKNADRYIKSTRERRRARNLSRRQLLGLAVLMSRGDRARDAELLELRQENAVLHDPLCGDCLQPTQDMMRQRLWTNPGMGCGVQRPRIPGRG